MRPHAEIKNSGIEEFRNIKKYGMELNGTVTKIPTPQKLSIVWKNVIMFSFLHLAAIYGFYLLLFKSLWLTKLFNIMPPYAGTASFEVANENMIGLHETDIKPTRSELPNMEILWRNVFICILLNVVATYGLYVFIFKALWLTDLFEIALHIIAILGITAGAHRLWTHKSYKARLPLQILLMCMNMVSFEFDVLYWVRIHRQHHKYSDTDADPHNSRRGFFFSHVGWVLMKKHPEVKAKIKTIDMSDLEDDSLLKFQRRYFIIMAPLASLVIPTYIPTLWGETLWNSFFTACFRFVYVLHMSSSINSVTHHWGFKPYDNNIAPTENKATSFFALGEGFHNFHHTFPWDYRTAEIGGYTFNITKLFIDTMAAIGWAYDLKCVSNELIVKRAERSGDGSYYNYVQ